MEAIALVPLFILLTGGIATLWDPRRRRWAWTPAWVSLAGALAALARLWGQRWSAFGLVDSDPMGQLLGLMVILGLGVGLGWIETAGSRDGTAQDHEADRLRAGAWALFVAAGALALASTRSLLVLVLSAEVVSTGFLRLPGETPRSWRRSGGLSLLLLAGLVTLWLRTGSSDLAGIEAALLRGQGQGQGEAGFLVALGLGLLLLGLVARMVWLFDGDMSPARFALATVGLIGLTGALLRVTGWLVTLERTSVVLLSVLGVVLMGVGSLKALRACSRCDIARMLVGSSWAQAGLALVGVAAGGLSGRASALIHLSSYTVMSLGAYGVATALRAGTHRDADTAWRGLGWHRPLGVAALGVFLSGLAGLPLTMGFWGRFVLLRSAVEARLWWVLLAALIATFAGFHYYLRPLLPLFSRTEAAAGALPRASGKLWSLAVGAAGVLVLGLGVAPEPWLGLIRRVALELF